MSKKNNYNSIVFLTTLSVYLGLVLVGATPSILAQETVKGCFQIQSNANNKIQPSENDLKLYLASGLVGKPVQILIAHLNELAEQNKFNFDDSFHLEYLIIETSGERIQIRNLTSDSKSWLQDELKYVATEFTGWHQGSQLKRFNNDFQKNSYYSEVSFKLDDEGLIVKVKTEYETSEYAHQVATDNNSLFQNAYIQSQSKDCEIIYQNSQSLDENNQVFIVTRLPRGSLDTLLTTKDAQ